ncbi:tetratricopeptide repeat protein [Cryptosporangium japonicum]|uniref:Novel STAND NTPase 1 domain-containing protein n=1 Tax=Cryptosporangium japonicum TaxID=80872 RepID=A0ABP3DDD1_9ACTN
MAADQDDPYIGLRPYGSADRGKFFGRQGEVDDIRDLWLSSRLLVLYGESGVGKTSLLNAGVIPSLIDQNAKFPVDILPVGRILPPGVVLRPDPGAPNPYVVRLLSSWSPDRAPSQLVGKSIKQFILEWPKTYDKYDVQLPILAAIDQFEQVFTDERADLGAVEVFLRDLADAARADHRLHILVSVRAEQLASLLDHERAIADQRTRYRVFPLNPDAALEAVTEPLRSTNRSFAPGAAEHLVEDLRTTTTTTSVGETVRIRGATIEPVHLQVACSGLWRSLPNEVTRITTDYLQSQGGVDHLLRDFCENAVTAVATECGLTPGVIWSWLARYFVTDRGTRGTISEGIAETGDLPNKVAQRLEAHRILKSVEQSGDRRYELAHDRLLAAVDDRARDWWGPENNRADPSARGYLRQARAALDEGRQTLAENSALEAVRLSGPSAPAVRGEALAVLARVKAADGEVNEAIARYRDAIDVYLQLADGPAVGRLRADLGRLLRDSGDELGAMDELRIAVELLPADISAKIDLAGVLRTLGQYDGALGMLTAALIVAPDRVDALRERGLIHADRGAAREALADLRAAVRLDPTVADRADVRAALARFEGQS